MSTQPTDAMIERFTRKFSRCPLCSVKFDLFYNLHTHPDSDCRMSGTKFLPENARAWAMEAARTPTSRTMDEGGLEPCPFCRENPEPHPQNVSLGGGASRLAVWCKGCGALGPVRATGDEAIATWNTRASPPPCAGDDVERMREALKPFAMAYENEGDGAEFEDKHNLWEHPAALGITVGNLREARAAIAALGTTPSIVGQESSNGR